MNRERWLDELKGFLICLVVLGHVIENFDSAGLSITPKWAYFLFDFVSLFHTKLFILLSGFVWGGYYADNKKKTRSKIFNLLLLYIIHTLIYWLSKYVLADFTHIKVEMNDLLWMPVKPMQHLWYIYSLVFAYVFLIIIKKIKHKKIQLFVFVIATVMSIVFSMNVSEIGILRAIYSFFFFYYGYEIASNKILCNITQSKLGIKAMIVGVVPLLIYFYGISDSNIITSVVIHAITFLMCNIIFYIFKLKIISKTVFAYLGRHTLSIYLLHVYVITLLRSVWKLIGIDIYILIFFATIILSILISIIMEFVMKKIKLYSLLFNPISLFEKRCI